MTESKATNVEPRRPASSARGANSHQRCGSPWLGVVLGLALGALVASGCIVQRFTSPQLTGTCDGACAHYVQCKPGHSNVDRNRCVAECPDVFSDRDSLMAYESLTCDDAVEYVDGNAAKTASHH